FFFSSRRRHTRFSRDWSSDVCSSDLAPAQFAKEPRLRQAPIPPHRAHRYLEGLGRLFQAQSAKETELHDLALSRIERVEGFQGRSEERRVGNECCWCDGR